MCVYGGVIPASEQKVMLSSLKGDVGDCRNCCKKHGFGGNLNAEGLGEGVGGLGEASGGKPGCCPIPT